MAQKIQYIKAALLLFLTVSARADINAYRQHEALLKQYVCGEPQPRVFELGEIIGEDVLREKTDGFTLSVSFLFCLLIFLENSLFF